MTTLVVSILVLVALSHGGWGAEFELMISIGVGALLNVITGICGAIRREPTWGLVAMLGVVLWPAEIELRSIYNDYRTDQAERDHTWGDGGIHDFFVQPDGRIILLGPSLARILPDGSLDGSFHRDYSLTHGKSRLFPLGSERLQDTAMLMRTDGDMVFSRSGRLNYLRADGSKEAQWFVGLEQSLNCWGLAIEPAGNLLAACKSETNGNKLVRILSDGHLDPGFHSSILPLVLDPAGFEAAFASDGKILLNGSVQMSSRTMLSNLPQPVTRADCFSTLTRLNSDGSVDKGFRSGHQCQPKEEIFQGVRGAFAFMRDRSILAVAVNSRDGRAVRLVEHLDPNGREIPRSRIRIALSQLRVVTAILPLDDGRILVGGRDVRRFTGGGIQDPTFHAPYQFHGGVQKMLLQGEQVLVLDEDGHLSRLNNDGTLDLAFRIAVLKTS